MRVRRTLLPQCFQNRIYRCRSHRCIIGPGHRPGATVTPPVRPLHPSTRASSNPHPGSAPSPPGAEPRRATVPSFVTRSLPHHLLLRTVSDSLLAHMQGCQCKYVLGVSSRELTRHTLLTGLARIPECSFSAQVPYSYIQLMDLRPTDQD